MSDRKEQDIPWLLKILDAKADVSRTSTSYQVTALKDNSRYVEARTTVTA